jgi:hypothetical protein
LRAAQIARKVADVMEFGRRETQWIAPGGCGHIHLPSIALPDG